MEHLKHQGYNEWLIIRCQQGEREAFDALLEHWHRRFFLYALKRLGDRDAALDVTQECLLSISRGLGGLADPAAFPKWSFRILERRCVDSLRRTIRDRDVFQPQTDGELPELAGRDTMESTLTAHALLDTLDGRLAAILRLYYLEELSIGEIAEITALPTGTVKSRLFYARKLLGATLT